MIEFRSKTAKITDKVTPSNIAYTKYKIPTIVGGSFLNSKLNTNTATSSKINNILKYPPSTILKNSPEE